MYHRVANLPDYSYPIVVKPENFRKQIKYLRQAYQPISLDELALSVKGKSIPRRAIVLTFDDGYADNYTNALPVLDEYQVPATIFVSSGYIDKTKEYWWDDLERIFLSLESIPENLNLSIGGNEYKWTLENMEQRRSVRAELRNLIKPLLPQERDSIIEELVKWSGAGINGREPHRSMTREELKQLSKSQYIQIGGHTVNHPQLGVLPKELQYQEIMQGCDELTAITGLPVNTFSYPFGEDEDYSLDTLEIMRSIGFSAACTTHPARVVPGVDLLRLPRFAVGDWDLGVFRQELERYFNK